MGAAPNRANFGMFTHTGKTPSTGVRNNSISTPGTTGPASQGMAESLRAQIATPRTNNQVNTEEIA